MQPLARFPNVAYPSFNEQCNERHPVIVSCLFLARSDLCATINTAQGLQMLISS